MQAMHRMSYGVRFLGVHTNNAFTLLGGVSLGIAMLPGEIATLNSSTVDGSGLVGIGPAVTWTAAATLTMPGGDNPQCCAGNTNDG